jgi:hypothetical protein
MSGFPAEHFRAFLYLLTCHTHLTAFILLLLWCLVQKGTPYYSFLHSSLRTKYSLQQLVLLNLQSMILPYCKKAGFEHTVVCLFKARSVKPTKTRCYTIPVNTRWLWSLAIAAHQLVKQHVQRPFLRLFAWRNNRGSAERRWSQMGLTRRLKTKASHESAGV